MAEAGGSLGEADQEAIVRALASGAATGDDQPLRRIQTHMSHLFLGRDRVFKLKRSRRLPFADMTTAPARRAACEAELAVNRALAPDLYESVASVVRGADGTIRVGGEGVAVDWLVVMKRFPDGALLQDLAEAGTLTPEIVSQAADAIAAFHGGLAPHPEAGRAVDYRRILQGLRETEAEGAAEIGLTPGSTALFAGLEHAFDRLSPLIEARREAGWVRRGHGDLHLRNICLFDGKVTPFDALEFSPALATTDVLYDLAFLLMDLRARGLDDHANLAMNRYWDAARQDEDGLALLPAFMSLRAAVRMAVAVAADDLVEADAYRRLGLELLAPVVPRLVAIGGLSGTGKSTVAQAFAPRLPGPCGARLLRSDVIRKAAAGVAPAERLPGAAYQPAARAEIYTVLAGRARQALAAGVSVVADATFREDAARAEIEDAAHGVDFQGVWLRAPPDVRIGRVAARAGDASDADAAVAAAQTEPAALGERWRVVAADRPATVIAEELMAALRPSTAKG